MKHLVLVGLPGSGKTTLGREAAALAQLPFLDFDEEIERRSGLAPAEFFARHGEAAFRAAELELSRELAGRHTIVVSPGGGWIMQAPARAAVAPIARLVYLQVTPATAVARLGSAIRKRPLLAGPDPVATMTALLRLREPSYQTADVTVNTESVVLQELIAKVATLARECRDSAG